MIARLFRILLLIACVIIVAWSFIDFGRRQVGRIAQRTQKPIELTVLHWGNPAEDKIVDDLVKKFEAEHPTVRVTRINASDFRSKIKTMMAGGMAPDVFYLPPDLLPEFAAMQVVAPLDDRFAKEPQPWRDDFYPILLDAFRYDTTTGILGKGKLYALPKDSTTAVFYVNVDLCEKAGIDWKSIQTRGWTWDEFADATAKITKLSTPDRTIYGSYFQLWPDTIRNMLWTFDGEFFRNRPDGSPDFTQLALGDAGSRDALNFIRKLRLVDRTSYNPTGIAKEGGAEFLNGNIGCVGPIGRWMVPTYKDAKTLRWDVVPIPQAKAKASQLFYTGWSMSSATKHPDVAYDLLRFMCGKEGQVQLAQAGLAIPALRSVANSPDFLSPPGIPPHASHLFLDAIDVARLQQLPREQEFGRILGDKITDSISTDQANVEENARAIQRLWSAELNSPLRNQQWQPMPWGTIVAVSAAIGATLVGVLWWRAAREKLGPLDRATERSGWMFIAPWVIGFLAFTLGPMVVSLLLSFGKWSAMAPLGLAENVGTANYRQLLTNDDLFWTSIKVTAYYVLLGVPVTQIAALAVAMLMNSDVKGIAVFRTIYFVPSVVAGAALSMLWLQLYNNDYGLINATLRPVLANPGATLSALAGFACVIAALGMLRSNAGRIAGIEDAKRTFRAFTIVAGISGVLLLLALLLWALKVPGTRPPNWFGVSNGVNDSARWAIPAFVIMGLWGVGGGMIIYLAGLKGIPTSLYEAARIDGAGPWRRFWNVTLPMLSPLVFYNVVMGIIGSFQVFTQAYTMTGAGVNNSTLFYVLQLYRQAFEFHNMGYASAMAWVLFVLVLLLTVAVFKGSKSLVYYEGLRS
ncbi:MAG: extracellular solute-binding protein [Tepidisphaeraceae bacterium]